MLHTAYFDELGVGLDATDAQLRKAYLRLAKRLHPDRNPGDAAAKARFQRLERVYGVLRDGELRMLYLRHGEAGLEEADGIAGAQADEGGAEDEEEAAPITVEGAAEVAAKLGRRVSADRLREIVEEVNAEAYAPSALSQWPADVVAEEWASAEAAAAPALRWARKQISSLSPLDAAPAPRLAQALRVADFSSNRLAALPPALGLLAALRELDVSGNCLRALPAALLGLSRLEVFTAEHNALTTLPVGLGRLARLRRASFFGNEIARLPADCFAGMAALRHLDLSCNRIKRAPRSLVALRASNDGFNLICDPSVDFYGDDDDEDAADEEKEEDDEEESAPVEKKRKKKAPARPQRSSRRGTKRKAASPPPARRPRRR